MSHQNMSHQFLVIHPNAINLCKITDTSEEIIRGLKSIDSKANDRDVWLIYTSLQKVDSGMCKQWTEFHQIRNFKRQLLRCSLNISMINIVL